MDVVILVLLVAKKNIFQYVHYLRKTLIFSDVIQYSRLKNEYMIRYSQSLGKALSVMLFLYKKLVFLDCYYGLRIF